MPADILTIAVIGTGLIGPRHAQSVQSNPDARLLCVVDPRLEAKEVAEAFGVPLFESIKQMVAEGHRPDAAIVCTPNSTHVAVSLELFKEGIHVLVEKPISIDIASGKQLITAAEEAGRHLLVGHHRRFNPYVTATKNALLEGAVGRPIAVSGLWATYKPGSYFAPPTAWRAEASSGGPILINLIHEVDILQYLLGPISRVHAEKTLSQRGHPAEEGAAILLRFASGAVGTFILSDATPSNHFFESGTGENPKLPHSGEDFYRIFGSEGTLSVGDMKLQRYREGGQRTWERLLSVEDVEVGNEVPFDEQVKNLVGVIRGTQEPRCTGADGLRALVVCDAVKKAMETGQAVDIE
ncbi:hypothetical protein M409DRAFT_24117 [Zasmidium cellare ATCC 36951]|uniref:Gfo/Idh/MocA-like oxidoreductase N-terminal domain-containing protein n=1 Tax=Zasmidium cellare ATCC 36951 TaxID=1080233 RepID=A0A6A6CI22_ZASCE|nr:uncharacterized protein M409DRAFT_24117 [Zasmidium cellare ATCC 36951]KAF2165830.1 hypothetical protein M409DRAFT_24117 [Zasmidium cellare ATCC 36951]